MMLPWGSYIQQTFMTETSLRIFALFFIAAGIAMVLARKEKNHKRKIFFLHGYFLFLITPFILSIFLWECGMQLTECTEKKLLLAIPITIGIAYIGAYIVAPILHQWMQRNNDIKDQKLQQFIEKYAKHLNIRVPKLYLTDEMGKKVYTYSGIRPFIVLSIDALTSLNQKELEAVLLHEIYHIKQQASWIKFSIAFMAKGMMPFMNYSHRLAVLETLERDANTFVQKIQKTTRFLKIAEEKI